MRYPVVQIQIDVFQENGDNSDYSYEDYSGSGDCDYSSGDCEGNSNCIMHEKWGLSIMATQVVEFSNGVYKICWLSHSSIFFGAKIEISGKKGVENTPIYIFGSKINKFERKKLGKNKKFPKA